jgi:hypothetical protein
MCGGNKANSLKDNGSAPKGRLSLGIPLDTANHKKLNELNGFLK